MSAAVSILWDQLGKRPALPARMSAAIMTQLPKEGVHSPRGDILGDPGSDVGGGFAPLDPQDTYIISLIKDLKM